MLQLRNRRSISAALALGALAALAAPALSAGADPCATAAPEPQLHSNEITEHSFVKLPDHASKETGVLDHVSISIETSGCADGVSEEISFEFPRALSGVKEVAKALGDFIDAHAVALQHTRLLKSNWTDELHNIAVGKLVYRLGQKVCTTTRPHSVMGAEDSCGLGMILTARSTGKKATRIRFVFDEEL